MQDALRNNYDSICKQEEINSHCAKLPGIPALLTKSIRLDKARELEKKKKKMRIPKMGGARFFVTVVIHHVDFVGGGGGGGRSQVLGDIYRHVSNILTRHF